jgi:hypothetical protein
MNVEEKIKLRDEIEKLDKNNHLEIFKILKKHNISFSENKNGSFINLNFVNDFILSEIKEYILYLKKQENIINELEVQKKEYEEEFFNVK